MASRPRIDAGWKMTLVSKTQVQGLIGQVRQQVEDRLNLGDTFKASIFILYGEVSEFSRVAAPRLY